jgi:D-3-phosphoglycerate dehydrogenase / 2-oxoglutarate reductase
MSKKILISARMFGGISDKAYDIFYSKGYQIVPNPYKGKALDEEKLFELLPGVEGIITGLDDLNSRVINNFPQLKAISKFGVGVDNIDIEAATKNKIIVTNTPNANKEAVADLAFALMMCSARKICYVFNEIRRGNWSLGIGTELWGKKLGILGLGKIGKGLALRARGFNMKVLVYEKYPEEKFVKENDIKLLELQEVLRKSDFISIHLPKTIETENLIGEKELKIMKKEAIIINTSRGGIVNEEELYRALSNREIFAAACDVFQSEPLKKNNKLLKLNNFIATPHMGAFTFEGIKKMEDISAKNLIDSLENGKSKNVVNKEVFN